ncbi:acetyltransferase [Sphingobium sp. Z007]|uniref:acetyltransferase n=1 Tax=Sphingobium sp. Z007 TaxID=627495 RepID=UPI000B4A49AF|nr:acetyltransferase [Sphingobium sp. Z007]
MDDLPDYLTPGAKSAAADPLDDYFHEVRTTALRQLPDPDSTAKANGLARTFGVNPSQADANLSTLERTAQINRAATLQQDHGTIARWAERNPRGMAAGADDVSSLGLLGKAFSYLKTAGQNIGGSLEAGLYQATSGIWGTVGAMARNGQAYSPIAWVENKLFGGSVEGVIADFSEARAREGQKMAAAARPDVSNWTAHNLLQGIESVPTTLASIGVGVLAGPTAGASVAGITTGGQEYLKARDKGLSPLGATVYASSQGAIEVATERLPIGHLVGDMASKAPVLRTFWNQIKSEIPGEQLATVLQDLNEWAALNPDKPFADYLKERPEAAAATLVATIGGVGATTGITLATERTARAAGQVADRVISSRRAQDDAAALDQMGEAASGSKLKARDSVAFADLVREMADDVDADNVFIPAEAVQAYMQSDAYDGDLDQWRDEIGDAIATGGDFVLPIEAAVSELAGKPAWDVLKEDMRLTAGGMSRREAQTFDEAMADVMAEMTDRMADEERAARDLNAPRDKLLQTIVEKLSSAGMVPSMARQNAEFLTQRAATRATRMGRELTGAEYDGLQVRQVLPEAIAAVQKADQLDVTIDVMKRRKDPTQSLGPTLMEFISRGGGIVDTGGDLKAMGADAWHREKPGKRKLLKDQGELLDNGGLGENEYGADAWAQRAWEAGYFPEFAERPTANEMLDAIAEGVAGRDRTLVSRDRSVRDAAEELRGLLENRGIDPDSASRADIRKAIEDYAAEQVEGDAYMQGEDSARGRILFPGGQSADAIIELFQTQDQSTFLHETGHLWLEELREDAADPDAPQQVRDDWQIVQDWFAANGHPLEDGKIPVDAHELWARGVERYLMEGKAPSPGMQRMFHTFKAWMISLYNSVSRLRSPISDDVRAVMDRLVASDEELANAVAAQHLEALFPDKPASMSATEYSAYQDLTAIAREEAQDRMLAKTMNAVKRRVTKEWREREEDVREYVTRRIDALPEFRALQLLKVNPIDSEWVRDHHGEDATAMLPRQVPPAHRENGANPDEVAEMAGFQSGDDMVRTLMGVEIRRREMRDNGDKRSVRKAMIEREVSQIMLERYGDPFTDGSIQDEALAAVQSDRLGEVMGAELRVLGRMTGNRVTPYSVAKSWAEKQIMEGRVRDVASRSAIIRYERAAAKAGKAAMDAVIAKDHEEAFRQKQAQMINNALVAAARRGADTVDEAVARLEKWAKRRTVKSVDQDYLERAQLLLEQVEMKERTQRSLNRQESFEAWAAQREAEGYDVVVPPSFAESLGKTHWSRLTVEKLIGLDEAVKQIIHLGKLKQTLIDGRENADFELVVGEAVKGMEAMKQRPPSDLMEPSRWDSVKGKVAAFDAALLKMEQVFDWLDGGNSNGAFNRIVFRPLADAQGRENAMIADYHGRIRREFEKLDRKHLRRWSERFSDPVLFNRETGQPYQMKREQLIALALNMGNAGNIQRLTDGYGWRETSVRELLNRELTPADWTFVQNVWDIVETLWPATAAMERRVNGVEPDKVEAVEMWVGEGATAQKLRGGYYPAIYDTSKSYAAEENAGKSSDLLDTVYTRASTRASSTKDRSEKVKRPILLQLGVINRHLGEVIHDITHREAVLQADKFLRSERIMRAVDRTIGPEIRKQFRPWLKYVANSWAMERAGNEGIGAFMQRLRANTTIVGMGFRFTTMMTQLGGYSNSIEYVGGKWVAAGIAQTTAHPIDSFNLVMEKSGEVRSRMDTLDRDIRLTMQQMQGRGQYLDAAKRFAFHGIGYMDRMVVVPTWIGAYNKAQAAGMDEEASIYAADKAVRLSQGSGSPKDLAAVVRGTGQWGQALRLMTQFYSYMSAFYQRQRTLGRDIAGVRKLSDLPAVLSRAWWLIVVPPLLSQILAGNGPGDDDDWGFWAFKQMLFQSLGPIPGVRDAASPIVEGLTGGKPFDYQFTPMQRAFQSVVESARDVHKAIEGKDAKRPVRNVLEVAGYWTGLVPGQVATSAQFLVDVGNGEQDPETAAEWYRGMTKGKAKSE